MIVRYKMKDAHVPQTIQDTMTKRVTQRLASYFKDEPEDATTITIRIIEQKSMYKVEMTLPYMGHTLRTENTEREISLPALDKGIDVLERQMKKLRTRLTRDLRKKPEIIEEALPEEEPEETILRTKHHTGKPMSAQDALLEMQLLDHSFYMFMNVDTGLPSTIYRRSDGGFGLIELETL